MRRGLGIEEGDGEAVGIGAWTAKTTKRGCQRGLDRGALMLRIFAPLSPAAGHSLRRRAGAVPPCEQRSSGDCLLPFALTDTRATPHLPSTHLWARDRCGGCITASRWRCVSDSARRGIPVLPPGHPLPSLCPDRADHPPAACPATPTFHCRGRPAGVLSHSRRRPPFRVWLPRTVHSL